MYLKRNKLGSSNSIWKGINTMRCFFPIDRIEKGSKVAMGGKLGKELFEWNTKILCDESTYFVDIF